MSKMIGEIRNANDDFYSNESLLKSDAYIETLGSGNIIVGILYIFSSACAVIWLRQTVMIHQFMRQASYENIGNMEVKAWAVRQAQDNFIDLAFFIILVPSLAMLGIVCWASFGIKKYELYKHQNFFLLIIVLLAFAQIFLALVLSLFDTNGGLFSNPVAACEFVVLLGIFLPQLSAGKLFYPLEFKNLPLPIKFINWIAEIAVKQLK